MIAENKQEFFEQLERELERLGVEDSTELMSDLEEHFAESERRGVPESETCRELGSIAEIARSCLDLKSEAINSMVARDVVRKRVSLTKPGHSVPADPTLAADAHEDAADEDCVRSYTPEHIREEEIPSAPQSAESVGGTSAESSQGTESSANGTNVGATSGSAAPQSAECAQSAEKCGVFERIGRTVDAACDRAGEAVNKAWNKAEKTLNKKTNEAERKFRPSDSYRKNVNNNRHGGDIPPQFQKAQTKGGGKFVDTTGLTPNVNAGRLIGEIILDVLLWGWLIPTLFALALAAFAGALALVALGVVSILGEFDFAPFHFVTRLLFALGFFNLAGFVLCIAPKVFKGAVSLVKHVFGRHLKAIYDI